TDLVDFQGKATAVYAQAYRKEEYAENQYDVYVLADVEYEIETKNEKNSEEEISVTVKREPVTLKIPIYSDSGKYVVEGVPVIVNDSMKLTGFSAPVYSGVTITDARVDAIKTAVTNFLSAYYEQDQDVIEYYLTKDADRSKFQGLSGRYAFCQMESINCYVADGGILCIVSFTVTDAGNGSHLLQSLNLILTTDGDKYYIKDMNTKTAHL
ncbi:MAG: conjugal transfer protein, partial [Lachnospiraceae bacterium]|nr:conjugal transfer protein [Lachnospiraceae bacterium]